MASSLHSSVAVTGVAGSNRGWSASTPFVVPKRVIPSITFWDMAGNQNKYSACDVNGTLLSSNNSGDAYSYCIADDKKIAYEAITSSATHIYALVMWAVSAEL